jgi:hypothetical protein
MAALRPICEGLSACGAGAGGFVVCVLKQNHSFEALVKTIDNLRKQLSDIDDNSTSPLSLHSILVNQRGVEVSVYNNISSIEDFLIHSNLYI